MTHTNTMQKAPGACDSKGLHTNTNASDFAPHEPIQQAHGGKAIVEPQYLTLTTKFILAFGLSFQLPVALTLMGKAGLVSSEGLASVRRYAIVVILVMAAIVTPPDVISQTVLFAVIYGLYEVSIQLVARIERKRAREEQEADV